MLTVLVRYQKSKREVVTPAMSVEFQPERTDAVDAGLLIVKDEVHSTHLGMTEKNDPDWRDVFIMNQHGATVARYTI